MSNERKKILLTWCRKWQIDFSRLDIFDQALTHSSYANEQKRVLPHNERLEFLGDAVLDMVVAAELYHRLPEAKEGELTKIRATIVCEPSLAARAGEIGLGQLLLLGRGELAAGGSNRASILADALEAVIGALYCDGGFGVAYVFISRIFADDFVLADAQNDDYKTALQEWVQGLAKGFETRINYEVMQETGPDHAKYYVVRVSADNVNDYGQGSGRSKKLAEQAAAQELLRKLKL